ncbi:MAG: hypothetical protein ACK5JT_02995 [Hyphomicrobiaceae bacterium]
MADGSGKPDAIIRRAEAAAADAASDARAEVLEQAGVEAPSQKHVRASKAVKANRPWHEFEVSVWLTNLNDVEFGIYKHSRNKAKSRQFTSDMDIYAEVIENGERTGLIGYRADIWKKSNGIERRLVMKLYNETLNWRASMDLMVGRSLQQTLGARGFPVTAYAMNIGDHEFVVHLERSADKWPLLPENFAFFLMDGGQPRFYRLRRDLINLGGDYTLLDERDRTIAHLDGRFVSITGHWRGRVKTEYAGAHLVMVLQLFCGMLVFKRSTRRHINSL